MREKRNIIFTSSQDLNVKMRSTSVSLTPVAMEGHVWMMRMDSTASALKASTTHSVIHKWTSVPVTHALMEPALKTPTGITP